MNVARILELADVIENVPYEALNDLDDGADLLVGFNMSAFHCGRAGCIAGWAAHLYNNGEDAERAEEFLDLSREDGDELFIPRGLRLGNVTPSQAAITLRKLAETGKVDWSHVEAAS